MKTISIFWFLVFILDVVGLGTHEEYETQYLYRCTLCSACTG